MTAVTGPADATVARIEREQVVAIVRVDGADSAVRAVGALLQGGLGVTEISLATPGALAALERCSRLHGDLLLGAGTVRSAAQARDAVAAGARFLVSPALDREVVRWAAEAQVAHLPGVLTPTELAEALSLGARLIKLFPAGRMGPAYVRDLLAPMPEARLVPTGGITVADAGAYLDAGAVAVALGSALVSSATAGDPAALAQAAARLRATIASRQSRRPPDGH
jgi:2-dehydro-3-deoxyphosphogluconate aldolase/(4S)-4-hydroxy-2-oxoglutarate aldolase